MNKSILHIYIYTHIPSLEVIVATEDAREELQLDQRQVFPDALMGLMTTEHEEAVLRFIAAFRVQGLGICQSVFTGSLVLCYIYLVICIVNLL